MTALISVLLLPLTAPAEPVPTAKWLVDLGRDYPLSRQASVSDVDAEITLLFMQAASRVDPNLAEPYLWQYDMLSALGRDDLARRALGQYVRLQPDDVAAALKWIHLSAVTFQTAEERADFLRTCLKGAHLPRIVAGDLHRRLSEFYWNRNEHAQADTEAMLALQFDPLNLAARRILESIRGVPETPVLRVQFLLGMVAANPANPVLAQRLGQELVLLGMPVEADRWLRHAVQMHALIPPGQAPPDLLLDRAGALTDAGQLAEAREIAAKVVEADSKNVSARLALARIELKSNQPRAAGEQLAAAADLWKAVLENPGGSGIDPRLLAEMAWFCAHYLQKPEEAAKLARTALVGDPASLVAQRALGSALRQQKDLDQARLALTPAAEKDTWAAIELARTTQAAGESGEATQRLRKLATQPATGEERDEIAELLFQATSQPATTTRPAGDEVRQALAAFPAEILNSPAQPERYLTAVLTAAQTEFAPTDPWLCTLTLKNNANFSITIGPEGMLQPELLCSIQARGDCERTSGPSIRILLNRQVRLRPGETLQVSQTLGVGPIRSAMIGTPQIEHQVEVTAVLNPIRLISAEGKEIWAPGPGGFLLAPLKFTRTAFLATPEAVRGLIAGAQQGNVAERIAALQLLAMLIGERQHLAASRLGYAVRHVDVATLQPALLARADDPDWEVRARLAESLRYFILDKTANQTATRMLADGHWLVRGLTLRMLADHHGDKLKDVLQKFADKGADQWERQLARALLDRNAQRAAVASAPAPATASAAVSEPLPAEVTAPFPAAAAVPGVTPQSPAKPVAPPPPAAGASPAMTPATAPTPTTAPVASPPKKILTLPD